MNAMEIWGFAVVVLIICTYFILLKIRLKTYSYQFTDLQ